MKILGGVSIFFLFPFITTKNSEFLPKYIIKKEFILFSYFFCILRSKCIHCQSRCHFISYFQLETLKVLNGVNRNWTSWFYRVHVFLTNLDTHFKMPCSPGHRILKNAVLASTIKCSLANMTLILCLCSLLVFVLNQMWDELTHPLLTSYYIFFLKNDLLTLLILVMKGKQFFGRPYLLFKVSLSRYDTSVSK